MEHACSSVVLERRLAPHARTQQEDWSGVASAAERRKIQNRINARAFRQRRAREHKGRIGTEALSTRADALTEDRNVSTQAGKERTGQGKAFGQMILTASKSHSRRSRRSTFSDESSIGEASPYTDLLLELVTNNLHRALLVNISFLGFDPMELFREDLVSPITSGVSGDHLPGDLKPTALQRAIPHHPIFDVVPDPQLRERLIACQGQYDKAGFCHDLIRTPGEKVTDGLIIWQEPYVSDSWEMSEGFFRKWHSLLSGCTRLIESTNRWRAVRGEEPLRIEEAG